METKRCPRCHKLLRADAEQCSRCGIAVAQVKGTRKLPGGQSRSGQMPSQPTSPLASPHRAGHYLGLHPEDQPFQSSFFQRIQRPVDELVDEPTRQPAEQLDDDLAAGQIEDEADDTEALIDEELLDESGEFSSMPARQEREWLPVDPLSVADTSEGDPTLQAIADSPTFYPLAGQAQAMQPTTPARAPNIVPVLIGLALLSFLLASSLLTFLLLGKSPAHSAGPQLVALPATLRVDDLLQLAGQGFRPNSEITLTRDSGVALLDAQGKSERVSTNKQGVFQVHIPITTAWKPGAHTLSATDTAKNSAATTVTIQVPGASAPLLRLQTTHLDVGDGDPGAVSQKNLTLTNAGGGQITWKASSQEPWLTLNPTSGTFAGSVLLVITVDRTNLVPQAYLGQIVFDAGAGGSQTLYVSMTVDTTPADLVLSTASLAFQGTPVQNPTAQIVTLQNGGGQTLDWTVGSTTEDGTSWLSVTPASGSLSSGGSISLSVTATTLQMTTGSYQGELSFSYVGGPVQQIVVTLTVAPPPEPVISLATSSLTFKTNQGFNPAAQSVTLSNTGNAPLNWGVQEDLNGQLYLHITPAQGTLAVGQSTSVTVAPVLGSASGPIASTLTFLDTDKNTPVASQQVSVTINITPEAVISILTGNLSFSHTSSSSSTSDFLIFTNSGSQTLNWSISTSPAASWLSFNSGSGSLAAGGFAFVTVTCNSASLKAGTYTVIVTVRDTDAHTIVAPQSFTITLVVS